MTDLRRLVDAAWCAVFGDRAAGADFHALGGTSLQAVELAVLLSASLPHVDISTVFEHSSIDALVRWALDESGPEAGRSLPSVGRWRGNRASTDATAVAGATGFIGRALTTKFLRMHRIVVGLGRADPEDQCRLMLTDAGALTGDGVEARRVRLDAPRLGLDPSTYAELTGAVDAVINLAADTSASQTMQRLWPVNVVGAANLARLSMDTGASHTFVSTFAVAPIHNGSSAEATVGYGDIRLARSAYHRTKWYAERCIESLAWQGAPVRIVRPARVVAGWRSDEDRDPPNDRLTHLLQAALRVGSWPDIRAHDRWTDLDDLIDLLARVVDAPSTVDVVTGRAWLPNVGDLLHTKLGLRVVQPDRWARRVLDSGPTAGEAAVAFATLRRGSDALMAPDYAGVNGRLPDVPEDGLLRVVLSIVSYLGRDLASTDLCQPAPTRPREVER